MEALRVILNKIRDCIELQNDATESQLKDLWNDLSEVIVEMESGKRDNHCGCTNDKKPLSDLPENMPLYKDSGCRKYYYDNLEI